MDKLDTAAFAEFPVLQTSRLTLRQITPQDAKRIFEMRANDRVNQFIARPQMEEVTQAEDLVQQTKQAFENQTAISWAGILRDQEEIIGTCGFNTIEPENLHAEIGGELLVDYWGKGIAFEAVEAIVNFGMEQMNLHTIEAKLAPENRGAIYILHHLGFVKEAHHQERLYFEGKFLDMVVYTKFNERHYRNTS